MQSRGLLQLRPRSPFVCHGCRVALRQHSRPAVSNATFHRALRTTGTPQVEQSRRKRAKPEAPRYVDVKDSPTLARPVPFEVKDARKEEAHNDELKSRVERLEEELRHMRKAGVFGDAAFLAGLTDEERHAVDQVLQKRLLGGQTGMSLRHRRRSLRKPADAPGGSLQTASGDASEPKKLAPKEQRGYLNRFNGYLKQADRRGSDPGNRKQLWRWYMRCRQNVPTFRGQISADIWMTLWETQAVRDETNPDRAAHLRILAEDMQAGGKELSATQKLAYIEALFLEHEHARAISAWEASEASVGAADGMADDFLVLGVQMFAAAADPKRAQKVAHQLLEVRGSQDYRALLPIIRAWTKAGGVEGHQRAWALYLCLREGLGTSGMEMDDYDAVTSTFLDAGKADLALGVFKDMMLTGDIKAGPDTSSAIYRKAMGTVGDIRNLAIDAVGMNKLTFEAMTVLPRRFQNKFFYGSWIKKLLGAREPDSAMLVVELMSKRGVQPDAKHLNGIIGAWIRDGESGAIDRAESLAWAMIDRRKQHAWEQRLVNRGDDVADYGPTSFMGIKVVPAATLETFCTLAEYFLRRENHDQVRWLHRSLRLSAIEPNAFFMTQVLYSQARTEGFGRVWQSYLDWTQRHGAAKPDLESWACLWDCLGIGVVATKPAESADATGGTGSSDPAAIPWNHHPSPPSPRSLFAMMSTAALTGPCPRPLHALILRTFLSSSPKPTGDLSAAVVALHALRSQFGIYPDESTAKTLVLHLARLEVRLAGRGRGKRVPDEGVRKVAQRLEQLAQARVELLEKQGADLEASATLQEDENLYLLGALLRSVMVQEKQYRDGKATDAPKSVEDGIERAAWAMGVGGLPTGDHLR